MRIGTRIVLWSALVLLCGSVCAPLSRAQEPGEQTVGRGQFAGMERVGGVVTAIAGPQVTIKGEDGTTYQVVTTDNTRIMRGRGNAIKLSDLKTGDGLMAMGNLDEPNKTLHAAVLLAVDAEQMKKLEQTRKEQMANLGKTFIAGRVMAVDLDNASMTIERPDGVSQTIGFDEGTSFKRGRMRFRADRAPDPGTGAGLPAIDTGESITLADVKAGDRVAGPGEVKNGRFVARQLAVMTPRAGQRRGSEQPGVPAGSGHAGAGAQPAK